MREAAETEERFAAPAPSSTRAALGPSDAGERAGEVRAELLALVEVGRAGEAELSRLEARAEAVEARRRRLKEEMSPGAGADP